MKTFIVGDTLTSLTVGVPLFTIWPIGDHVFFVFSIFVHMSRHEWIYTEAVQRTAVRAV